MDSNRTNIPMPDDFISVCAFAQEIVHAIVEIHVLAESNRLRIEPSVSGSKPRQYPRFQEEFSKAKGHNCFAGCFLAGGCFLADVGPVTKSTGRP